MNAAHNLLLQALVDPRSVVELTLTQWNGLLRQARHAKVLSRLAWVLERKEVANRLDAVVRDHLHAARACSDQHERVIRWEVNRIRRALHGIDAPVMLLKGAAYVLADLPPARGRLVTDIDIMTPRDRLDVVEQALLRAHWEPMTLHPYDQRYYRQYMHELPPMRHRERRTVLDLHHTILPETGRVRPDPRKLWESARPLQGLDLYTLSPHDMVLHSAAHLFQDGDLAGGLRDLTDLHDLLGHFGKNEPDFWPGLVIRAHELNLQRSLFYALRFCRSLLQTSVPDEVMRAADAARPPWPTARVMDTLAVRAFLPPPPDCNGQPLTAATACLLLYIRSHWLRMPPLLLARHLTGKAFRRWSERKENGPRLKEGGL